MNTQYKTKLRSSNTAKKISESKPDIMSSKTKSEVIYKILFKHEFLILLKDS